MQKISPKCPKCDSRNIVVRIKTNEMVCRHCGYIGKRNEFLEENKRR